MLQQLQGAAASLRPLASSACPALSRFYVQTAAQTAGERRGESWFADVPLAPKDPILGVTEKFLADQHREKMNLGVVSSSGRAGGAHLLVYVVSRRRGQSTVFVAPGGGSCAPCAAMRCVFALAWCICTHGHDVHGPRRGPPPPRRTLALRNLPAPQGAYRDDSGAPVVLEAVREAERRVAGSHFME